MTPTLEPVFTIEAEIGAARSAGASPMGERLHIPITGGQVFGPRLSGRVLPGGSDWPLIAPDGTSRIEARYTIETDDGTPIYVTNIGMRVSPPEVTARLRAGEAVAPTEYYMRGAPVFDAPAGPHRWLAESLFVCTITPGGGMVRIEVFRVT
ncbi:DUF3237 domain-containing protein [Mesobacterium pallidum]|uniref:DUF3237 domain-containing protein n=1 Tax=Mesobacterium pallidum TaxID=2872037 RepID=UPI001EE28ABA|nr:DUF3237 domain-containing protein [Mesobacterium pallidum]